jgi:hypothetical protein
MGIIALLVFSFMIYVEKSNQRRKIDHEYDEKITRRLNKIDPYYNFFYNLFGWAFALLVIYFIYLG